MSSETAFRIVLGIVIAITFAIRVRYSLNRKRNSTKKDVLQILVIMASLGWILSTIAYVIGLSLRAEALLLPEMVRIVGMLGMLVSAGLSIWVYRALGKYFFVDLHLSLNHELIVGGPYRYVRHPMYSVLFLSIGSSVLLASNVVVLITGLILVCIICIRIPYEEAMLIKHFGKEYLRYKECTGSLLPRLKL